MADTHVQVLGEGHPATAVALSELMVRYADEGDRDAIRALQERILRSMEHTLGSDDPRVRLARQSHDLQEAEPDESRRGQGPPNSTRLEKRHEG